MTQTVLLGNITTKIGSGATPRGGANAYLANAPFALIRSQNIRDEGFDYKGLAYINEEQASKLKNVDVQEGDILLNITGDSVARVGRVPSQILPARVNQHVAILRPDNKNVDSNYLYYSLIEPSMNLRLLSLASTGATRNALTKIQLEKLKLNIPNLAEQNKIANILGTIDEKIELNRRMNKTLEQMGQALFRHYFITNPEAKKWGMVQLGKKITPKRGKSLQSRNMIQGNVPVISGGLRPAGLHNESNTKAPVVTVSASGANAGFVTLWNEPVWSADSSYIDTTITSDVYFYYLFMKNHQDAIYGMQTGSGQPHIYPKHIELLEIPDAPRDELNKFNELVTPNFRQVERNKQEIQTLTTLRDTLLPHLISGKLKV